jgi:hypothetical protein
MYFKKTITNMAYFISNVFLKFGIWLDKVAYNTISLSTQMTYNIDKGRYWWQK